MHLCITPCAILPHSSLFSHRATTLEVVCAVSPPSARSLHALACIRQHPPLLTVSSALSWCVSIFHTRRIRDRHARVISLSLAQVNLLLFPGGAASLQESSAFFQSAKWMFEQALSFNTHGDYFPVHGT